MAVLGVQLVFSMVMASVLSKLSPHFSVARWLICGRLIRYLHPTDDELKAIAGVPTATTKKGRRNEAKKIKDDTFTIPKSTPIQLEGARIRPMDILPLQFYTEFQWLVDFSFAGIFIYIMTEIYFALVQPQNELNLSMMWCMLVLGFCIKVLFSLTSMYFCMDEGGEKMLCVMFGFFFLVLAMGVLVVDEDTLEFGLKKGHDNFTKGANEFLATQGIESSGPATLLTFRIILAIMCAFVGAFMTFPGLRLAKMHSDSMIYASENPLMQLCLNINMMFPALIVLMWVKPVAREYLVNRRYKGEQLIDGETFEALRILLVLLFCLLRFLLSWTHLQSHLNLACVKVRALKSEAGRISSVELQRMVARVFYYLCVVTLQYLAPIILLLYCTLLLKTLGNFCLSPVFHISLPNRNVTSAAASAVTQQVNLTELAGDSVTTVAAHFSLALTNLKQVFTPMYFRGLFSFAIWWICTTWFTTTLFGLMYYSYFNV